MSGGLELVAAGLFLFLCRAAMPAGFAQSTTYGVLVLAVSALLLGFWQPLGLVVTLVMLLVLVGWLRLTEAPGSARGPLRLGAIVTLLLLPLLYFKYLPWLAQQGGAGFSFGANWMIPLGLSFTTFRLIGVAVDRQVLRLNPEPMRLAVMTLLFPTFQAGPITGLQTFAPLPVEQRPAGQAHYAAGRILSGLLRKVVLADLLHASVIGPWLAAGPASLAPQQALVLPVLLGLYVYWDFAGYSDIAIGTACLAGFKVPENFNRPYFSGSVAEFWRRWHITLSEWIRLRLTMKLVNRRSPVWHFSIATLVSMLLCGLWHGAGMNFVVWGLWHGAGLVAVQWFGELQRRSTMVATFCQSGIWQHASVVLTFAFVTLGWTVFFLPLDQAAALLARAASYRPADGGLALLAGTGAALAAVYGLGTRPSALWSQTPAFVRGVAVSMALALVTYILVFRAAGSQEFVYSQF